MEAVSCTGRTDPTYLYQPLLWDVLFLYASVTENTNGMLGTGKSYNTE